jgi:hypothetical protein
MQMDMGLVLQVIVSLVSLVCYILVIVQMFQHNQTGMGVACLVGLLLCGIGGLVAFIYGWVKAGEWRINNIMLTWTAAIVAGFILGFIFPINFGPVVPAR